MTAEPSGGQDEPKGGQRPWLQYPSPLRYPGGKRKLATFVKLIIEANGLEDGEYAEVYAGGAAIALELLYEQYVRRIHINDLDSGVYAFWQAARDHTDEMCSRVQGVELSMDEWRRQRSVHESADPDPIDLAFATFYLNRTNRSGIITGGPIGGYKQAGSWDLGARFRRVDLVRRLERFGRFGSLVEITNRDGADFLRSVVPRLPEHSLVYLDPPYFVKGQEMLYANSYQPRDHEAIARLVAGLTRPWMVSYDDIPDIRQLYGQFEPLSFDIAYTAQSRYRGREVAFVKPGLDVPHVKDPARVTKSEAAAARALVASAG